MTWWSIIPRDPLITRDGRPFGAGVSARSLDFPTPSAVAGTLRTRIGFACGEPGRFGLTPDEARAIVVGGPLLVRICGEKHELLLPAPADCLVYPTEAKQTVRRFHLTPTAPPADVRLDREGLLPSHPGLPDAKPDPAPPRFWDAATFERWLAEPRDDELPRTYGIGGIPREVRVHVAMVPDGRTAEDGQLFATDGLRFTLPPGEGTAQQLGLAVRCDHPRLREGFVTLGGERRLSTLAPLGDLAPLKAPAPARRARVVLLTPAWFGAGAVPPAIAGAKVLCAAVGRPQAISGWDLEARGPKPVRRLAPAGSVYWVELSAGLDPVAWQREVHLQSVSDDEQGRRDGFGLAAVGAWRDA